MKKIVIKIKENSLIIKERIKLTSEYKNIINTNVISCNELIFSDEYIINNKKIVTTFLNEIINNYNVNTLIIDNNYFAKIFLEIIKNNKNIVNLLLNEENTIILILKM